MSVHEAVATTVSISRLGNSEAGWMTVQAMFNKTSGLTDAFFGCSTTGSAGKNFFERVLLDNQASTVEVFEIIGHTSVSRTVGIVSLGSGYPESTHEYIQFIFIVDGMRSNGIGSQAVKLLEIYAAKTSNRLTLTCPLADSEAGRFWRRNGYVSAGSINLNWKESDANVSLEGFYKDLNG